MYPGHLRQIHMKETILTPKYQILSGTAIKLPAAVLMFFDHIHEMIYWHGAPMWLTMPGRPAFPLFLFMSAEAFHYTRDRKKYLRRLLAGTLAASSSYSTVLVNILLFTSMILPNVMMAEGGIVMCLIGLVFNIFREKRWVQIAFLLAISVLLFIRSPGNIQWMMAFAAVPMPYTDVPCTGSGAFSYVQRNRKYLNQRNFSYNIDTRNKRE